MLKSKVKIGIVGCGAVGCGVALFIDKELKNKASIHALADKVREKAVRLEKELKQSPKILDIDTLIKEVDLVIETASQEAAKCVLDAAVALRKDVIILTVGALIKNPSLLKKTKEAGIKVYIPSGAICGVDGVGALGLTKIKRISLTTSKPPKGLLGAEYLKRKRINLTKLKKERVIFKGKVVEAIKHFPKNINVSATLLLACGAKNVEVAIKADPHLKRNTHRIELEAEEARVTIVVENVPSKMNPKTSAITILSTQYLLKKIFSPFKIGS